MDAANQKALFFEMLFYVNVECLWQFIEFQA